MKFENPAIMLVFSVTTLGTNSSVPSPAPQRGSDDGISSIRRRPLLLQPGSRAGQTDSNKRCPVRPRGKTQRQDPEARPRGMRTNQVDMRT